MKTQTLGKAETRGMTRMLLQQQHREKIPVSTGSTIVQRNLRIATLIIMDKCPIGRMNLEKIGNNNHNMPGVLCNNIM